MLHPVVNWIKRAISVWLKLLIAVQNQPITFLNSGEFPLAIWWLKKERRKEFERIKKIRIFLFYILKSLIEYSPVPHNSSSSSFSSKMLNRLSGIMPFRPFKYKICYRSILIRSRFCTAVPLKSCPLRRERCYKVCAAPMHPDTDFLIRSSHEFGNRSEWGQLS